MHLHLTVYTTQFHIESTSSLEVHHQPHDSPAWTVQHFYHTYHYQATIVAYYTICIDEKYQFRASLWQIIEVRHAFCVLHMDGSARPATDLSVMGLFMCPSRRGRVFWHMPMAMGGGIIAYRPLAKTMKLPWTGVLAWYIRCCCTNGKTCTTRSLTDEHWPTHWSQDMSHSLALRVTLHSWEE